MDIVIKGHNVQVPARYRAHVAQKLRNIARFDHKLIRIDVELSHERNPRQADHCQRVEITCYSRGPAVRVHACAADFLAALDAAIAKLNARLRRAADRRRVHRGRRTPVSVAAATAGLSPALAEPISTVDDEPMEPVEPPAQPWRIACVKEHAAEPMTIDDALAHMELVGHDFYLFLNKESGRPSVVYRRKGYDYGVISLAA